MLTNEITFDYKRNGIFGCSECFHFSFPYNVQLQVLMSQLSWQLGHQTRQVKFPIVVVYTSLYIS